MKSIQTSAIDHLTLILGTFQLGLVALMIIFCVLGAAFTFTAPAIAQNHPEDDNGIGVTITTTAMVPENVSICVVRVGTLQPDGTVLWTPGYAYPGISPSQCQDKTEDYIDVLGQTVVVHQFVLTTILYTAVVVTITETVPG